MASVTFERDGITFIVAADDKYRTTYTRQNGRHEVKYAVPYEQRFAARKSLVGWCEFVPTTAQQGYLSRKLPHFADETEGKIPCSVCVVDHRSPREPVDPKFPHYSMAILDCIYESPRPRREYLEDSMVLSGEDSFPDEGLLKRYVSWTNRDKSRTLATKGGVWRWKDTTRPVTEGSFIQLSDVEFLYTWHEVPKKNLPLAKILSLRHRANAVPFGPFAAGKLVFNTWTPEEIDLQPDMEAGLNVTYSFLLTDPAPNFFPDPARGWRMYEIEAADGSGNKPYPVDADFKELFRPVAG